MAREKLKSAGLLLTVFFNLALYFVLYLAGTTNWLPIFAFTLVSFAIEIYFVMPQIDSLFDKFEQDDAAKAAKKSVEEKSA